MCCASYKKYSVFSPYSPRHFHLTPFSSFNPPTSTLSLVLLSFLLFTYSVYGLIFARCRELVEKEGINVNKGDEESITVLHWAAINNRIPVVSFFLQKGADINAIGGELKSPPIHWATRWASIEICLLNC